MITVALIGPDGAGKTTIAKLVADSLGVPAKYLYMGINLEASNNMAPTARLLHYVRRWLKRPAQHGPPALTPSPSSKQRFSLWKSTKSIGRLLHQLSDEWYRQLVTWRWQRRGHVVLFDRHYYFDYYATDIAPGSAARPIGRRIHGYLLQHYYPHPDLVIYLDAPSEVMYARKGEGTVEILEQRRQGYLALGRQLPNFVIVNADQEVAAVVEEVRQVIRGFRGVLPGSAAVRESVTV